jgi:hypothetical protein
LPPPLVDVFDLLRRLMRFAGLLERGFQRFNPASVTRFGCVETGRSGSSVSAAVSALSSLVKATLTLGLRSGE